LENAERYAELIMERINSSKRIPQENKKATEAWVNFMKARGLSPKTSAKHVFCFEKFLDYLPKKVKISKATREQIETAAGTAWELYEKKKEPEHRRFDMGNGE